MKSLYENLGFLSQHLILLDKTFKDKNNYSNEIDYDIYHDNAGKFTYLVQEEKLKYDIVKNKEIDRGIKKPSSFADEIYSESDRQMKLADIIEYLFFSRGVYYLFQSNQFKKDRVSKFLQMNLRFVNMLMVYEISTVDKKLRNALLTNLRPLIGEEEGYKDLVNWNEGVGLSNKDKRYKKNAPDLYFDRLLPKTAGGLWHEILVYCFILKYNIGYIFPLLLSQKPISLTNKLSPPDLIILHKKTFRYYGIEIGNLKERQSGGFMAPSGVPVIPIDTLNARISDRCPTCGKWIGICEKVINDFSKTDLFEKEPTDEIRCLTECNIYSLDEKLSGKCKFMKFRYKNPKWEYDFADGNHHHYHCCLSLVPEIKDKIIALKSHTDLEKLNSLLSDQTIKAEEESELMVLQNKLRRDYSFIKTHSIYYSELVSLHKMNIDSVDEVDHNDE